MSLKQLIAEKVASAMIAGGIPKECPPAIALAKRPEHGDFQANGIMGAAKKQKTNPRELAQQVLPHLEQALQGIACKLEIAGPGFINIFLDNAFIASRLAEALNDEQLTPRAEQAQTIVIDYSSPNLAKEMHVGHLRTTALGDVSARLLAKQGHNVIRQNHMGDWGTQFGMLIAELEEAENNSDAMALADLEKFYQQAKAHFDEDEAFAQKARDYVVRLQSGDEHCMQLWQRFIDISVEHSESIYKNLNVLLEKHDIMAESAYNDLLPGVIQTLEEKGLAVEDDGAKIVFVEELKNKAGEPSPMIVQKSGGGFLYATTDLAAVKYRSETLQADRVMYFIDARQALHMKQVYAVSRLAGFAHEGMRLEHLAFGTIMGKDGKPFKTRSGGTVKLADLLQEAVQRAHDLLAQRDSDMDKEQQWEIAKKVGIGAVKYADLSKTRTNDYIFDWDSMLSFEGNTAPYLQYAYTRIRSILRKADSLGDAGALQLVDDAERRLALQLLAFKPTVEQLAEDSYPHNLCTYIYETAAAFMSFYEACPILKDDVSDAQRQSRLALANATARVLQEGLDLLGIEVMEQM